MFDLWLPIWPLFSVGSKDIAMAINFWSKLAKSDYSPVFTALAFGNGLQYHTLDFRSFTYDYLAISCKRLVKFSPVTPEFKRVKCVHPSSISSLLRHLSELVVENYWNCNWQSLHSCNCNWSLTKLTQLRLVNRFAITITKAEPRQKSVTKMTLTMNSSL